MPSPFKVFSDSELQGLAAWLHAPEQGLNLTDPTSPNLTISDNYIWHIEELKPNKTDVLAFLEEGKAMPRFARVVINEGGKEVPWVTEYSVGPLPICNGRTKIEPLDYFYNGVNGPRIGIDGRFSDGALRKPIEECVTKYMSSIADITQDILGLSYYGRTDNRTTLAYFVTNPSSRDGTNSLVWSAWRRKGLANYLQITDFSVRWDFSGTDGSLYKLAMIFYNNVVYTSVEDFREAWEKGEIEKRPFMTEDESFIRKDRKGTPRDLEDRMAPTVIEPEGKRYKVDTKNKYIEYMGFKFYTRFDRDVGIQFYDIKFKEERIMYELSLQDAIAQYSGNNPFQSTTAYMDRYYGIGAQVGRLIPGYDCPYHATYWDSTFSAGLSSMTVNNSICIFETDIGVPVTRHTDPTYMQATKGSKLVVRQIATIGNYDYLWDYSFYVDGTISVDAHASGYVQATYYRPEDEGLFGPRIAESISGTLHTHVMNFKADFDIVDAQNTILKTEIVVENVTHEFIPEYGPIERMRYDIKEIETEDEGILNPAPNGQTMYTVVHKNALNKWGEARGYRILPGLSNVHLPSMRSPFFLKSAEFAKQAMAITRHHDSEQGASAALNQNVPEAPLVEFWKFLDGESLVQEDIVAWVNLGMQHYTRSEDIPNTLMSEAHSSIMFAPQNFGTTEGTVDLQNAIIYNAQEGVEVVQPEMNGVEPPTCFPIGTQDQLVGVFEGMGIAYAYDKDV
ncbi:copper amine oxidase [Plectosphaerella plurivora]|uniref:Amine oxidase n=1 Tax=Plectosphaerella plurivora TaxID=936078 RepID=A0A9P8V2B9_9PEZI|nr:copper amine oxidase [Plectosphaerella plurivora]